MDSNQDCGRSLLTQHQTEVFFVNSTLKQIKEEQKALANNIREQKVAFKNAQREIGNYSAYSKHGMKLHNMQWEYRHKHIAYCQLHGTPYFMIECPRNDNKPDKRYVREIMEKYEQKAELRAVQH